MTCEGKDALARLSRATLRYRGRPRWKEPIHQTHFNNDQIILIQAGFPSLFFLAVKKGKKKKKMNVSPHPLVDSIWE
jgi:hypothetical protein